MKRKFALIIEPVKILFNFLLVPLSFIKIYHSVAFLPYADDSGDVARFDYYYSLYDKFFRVDYLFLLWLSFAIALVSIALSITNIVIKDNKKLMIASHVIFGLSVVYFLALLLFGAFISFNY